MSMFTVVLNLFFFPVLTWGLLEKAGCLKAAGRFSFLIQYAMIVSCSLALEGLAACCIGFVTGQAADPMLLTQNPFSGLFCSLLSAGIVLSYRKQRWVFLTGLTAIASAVLMNAALEASVTYTTYLN